MQYVITILTALIAAALPPTEAQAQESTPKIAYLTDLSGPGAYWGTRSIIGAQMAIDELAAEGISLELVIGDHRLDTRTAVSETQKATMVDGVDALVIEFAPTAIAASPVARRAKKLFLNASAATSLLQTNPYAFTGYFDYEKGCQHIAHRWKARGIEKIGVMKPVAEFAELCLTGAKTVYPDLIVQEHRFSEPLQSQVTKMKHLGVEAILSPGLEGDMINLLKAMDALKYQVPVAGTRQDSFTQEIVYKYGHMLEGAISFGLPAVPASFVKQVREYRPDLELKNLEPVAYGYFYVMKVGHALAACKNTDLMCQVQSLEKVEQNQLLPFLGGINRRASYRYLIEEWYGSYSYPLEERSLQGRDLAG